MDYNQRIEELLTLYLAAESTLEQECELRQYFVQAAREKRAIPEKLRCASILFGHYDLRAKDQAPAVHTPLNSQESSTIVDQSITGMIAETTKELSYQAKNPITDSALESNTQEVLPNTQHLHKSLTKTLDIVPKQEYNLHRRRWQIALIGIAASVLIAVGVFSWQSESLTLEMGDIPVYAYLNGEAITDREMAMQITKQTLAGVSTRITKSFKPIMDIEKALQMTDRAISDVTSRVNKGLKPIEKINQLFN